MDIATAILIGLNGAVLGVLVGAVLATLTRVDKRQKYYQKLSLNSPRDLDIVLFSWLRRRWEVVLTMHDESVGKHIVILEKCV